MEINNTPEEINFELKDMIVSSTDKQGNITYVNDIFCKIAGYTRDELLGKPHSIIRHEGMPKAIFKLLWQKVLNGEFIYAFVKNKAKNGNYYWVKAYVKPIIKNGEIVQITSYRKKVNDFAKNYIEKLYSTICEYEKSHSVDESLNLVLKLLEERKITYDQFIDRLSLGQSVENKDALAIDLKKFRNDHVIFKANIFNQIKHENFDVEVVDSCCCDFGKTIASLGHASFTKTDSWQMMCKYHDKVHGDMRHYVQKAKEGATQSELNHIVADVEEDTIKIFEYLADVKDNCKE